MSSEEIKALKQLIISNCEYGIDEKGINFKGFCDMYRMMLTRLKMQDIWRMLNHYNFDTSLKLIVKPLEYSSSAELELSEQAITFLNSLFHMYAENAVLSYEGLLLVFSSVKTPPWENEDPTGWIKLNHYIYTAEDLSLNIYNWISIWVLSLYLNPTLTYHYLAYLGYESSQSPSIVPCSPKPSQRRTCISFVYGMEGVGKSSLLKSFLYKPITMRSTHINNVVCGMIEEGEEIHEAKFLIVGYI